MPQTASAMSTAQETEQTEKQSSGKGASEKAQNAFRTISEVADDLGVPSHVLRFWEQKFSHINPLKRRGGRRYYRPEDVDIIREVKSLLYEEGYTIKGAQRFFSNRRKESRGEAVVESSPRATIANDVVDETVDGDNVASFSDAQKEAMRDVLHELESIRKVVNG